LPQISYYTKCKFCIIKGLENDVKELIRVKDMRNLGFSNVIISNDDFKPDDLELTVQRLTDVGFKRLFFAKGHDVTSLPLCAHKKVLKETSALLKNIKHSGASLHLISNILMTTESIYEDQISKLSPKNSQYIFVDYPAFDGKLWIDSSLNYLLYKQKKMPVFMSFEKNIATYDKDFLSHILSTRLAVFMIDLNSFANPNAIPYLKRLIKKDVVIIPGVSGNIGNYSGLCEKMDIFRDSVGQELYTRMILNSSKSTKAVFGLTK